MRLERYRFTLLEMLVSVTLLAMLASLALFCGKGIYEKQRFEHQLSQLRSHIQLLHSLAVCYGSDMELTVSFEKGTCMARSSGKEVLPYFRYIVLPSVISCYFNQKKVSHPLAFHIFSSGDIEPKGVLEFEVKGHHYGLDLRRSFSSPILHSQGTSLDISIEKLSSST